MFDADLVIKRCRATADLDFDDHDPRETFGWTKKAARKELDVELDEVADLQKRLYAQSDHAVLVVLQGIDASGKGGTIREVIKHVNPAGVDVSVFGVPSKRELTHDYLWRIHARTPAKGRIGIFDRSHYEDVLVVRVKGLAPEEVWRKRYGHIVDFERLLTDEGTTVIKCFLNISKEKQRLRIQGRVDSPDEHWKFDLGDLDDRARWDDYYEAFGDALRKTSTDQAPWYVVPGDRKWVRNLVVAKILRHHLDQIDPQYPPIQEGAEGIVIE